MTNQPAKHHVDVPAYDRWQPEIEKVVTCEHCGTSFSYWVYATGFTRACCSPNCYAERKKIQNRERQRRYRKQNRDKLAEQARERRAEAKKTKKKA